MSALNETDTKKRKQLNNEEPILESSTKKIKVQAQRKFAQNAVTQFNTQQKPVQSSLVSNNVIKPPIKRPNTEDFLTFLCFRGTSLLPPRLDFFNKPQRSLSAQEIIAGKKRKKSSTTLPTKNVVNNVVKNGPGEKKNVKQQVSQTKYASLTKLGQKVIGRNLVRSSSRYAIRQEALTLRQLALRHGPKIKKVNPKTQKPQVPQKVQKAIKKSGKQIPLDGKQVSRLKGRITRSNSLPNVFGPGVNQLRGKWVKGKPSSTTSKDSNSAEERSSRKKTVSKNIDHQSDLGNVKDRSNDLSSKVINKNERNTRSLVTKHENSCNQDIITASIKKCDTNTASSKNKAKSLVETKVASVNKKRTCSVDNIRNNRESKDSNGIIRSRPPRKTKEAATIYMEMLKKDMRFSDENDDDDDSSSIESFPELPNLRLSEARERKLNSVVKVKRPPQNLCKRNLRPRRSSTMLEDYIMTDSEEDEKNNDHKTKTSCQTSKSTSNKTDEPGVQCKSIDEESIKKNPKTNKTDFKLKKDLNKHDSDTKKSHNHLTSNKNILKCDKELEIKKKNNVENKKEKSLNNKTDTISNVISNDDNSTNNVKKVTTKDPVKKDEKKSKKPNLDLYNNNKKMLSSPLATQIPSMFNSNASDTKEELLDRMAVNFVNKSVKNDKKSENKEILTKINANSGKVKAHTETKKITKTEKKFDVPIIKEENEIKLDSQSIKTDNVCKFEKKESLNIKNEGKTEKVGNKLFSTVTKELCLEKKDIKINVPGYFSDKSFQLPKFKQDDGLSVLSEICSALPRFNEPFVPNRQLLTKLPTSTESSFVKYVDDKKEEKTFESRTMKMVNLARNSKDKKDLATSWKQAFKNVKVPKNGLSTNGNTWVNGKQNENQTQKLINNTTPENTNKKLTNDLIKNTLQSTLSTSEKKIESQLCPISTSESKSELEKKGNSTYLAKTTILASTKYDLKFEKRLSSQEKRKEITDNVCDEQTPEKKIFQQRRLSTAQSCSGNSSDAFSPENETSVYAFQPDLPIASTPFRRSKPQSPVKSRTVSPNTSIAVSFESDSMEGKSQSTISNDADSEEGRLFYIPLPAGVQAQPLIQGVTVKLGTEGPQNKLVMSAKLVTKPPAASTIPVSSISPKPERKIKPLCTSKTSNKTTPVGTVQPTTRAIQPPKCIPSTSKEMLPLTVSESKVEEKKHLMPNTESKKLTTISDKKNIKKTEKQVIKRKTSEKVAIKKKIVKKYADMVDAPTFYPTEEEFKDPLEYFETVKHVAQKFGVCRIVPPANFKPECKVSDDMRFTAYNQYVHKMMDRWGPNVHEMIVIKKYLETQSIVLSNPPLIGGMELDLPRLYHTVQELGGLKEVIELDKWSRVADLMKIPKSAQDRVTKLDDIYCKYLLPYDTLSHDERQKLMNEVDKEWKQVCRKGDTENELFGDVNDCITKGRSIALSAYYRVARNTSAMWFKETQTNSKLPGNSIKAEEVESMYWKQVEDKKNHICVLSGSIDSGAEGYGFPTTKTATFTKHPWNLKVLTNNPVSVLKSLGPIMGMTVPTIHMGMIFSACCWYKDPHGLPWIEYLHTGADKIWYSVPSDQSAKFRQAMKTLLPRAVAEGKNNHTWLAADSGMVPPSKLLEHGVTLTRTVQNPGQFLIVMPNAYTCNISTGYVISESVYFTQNGWLNNAEKIFQDLQRNCEPAAFSFEKLLINMSTDSRTPNNVLKQLLDNLSNMRDCEVALRSQLEDLGLKASERLQPVNTSKSTEQDNDFECDVCNSILYISMVHNSYEDCDYCLRHAIEILSKKHNQLKHCKFMYTLNENELDSIIVKLQEKIESKKKKLAKVNANEIH
ncbi:uncharacterized protein LOC126838229 isoform X2 [Adelges cooleyi]|uniref:uncharacterized protein LOC126838229 isoform X2 n=1 Tax=Adelges cooleyi TaxID=133065 RepID=UPI0021802847|nr:uncharacterized protein LOC126838229 isoform X2 [Adelges cooleyi]